MEIRVLSQSELEGRLNLFCDLYNSCFNDEINQETVRRRYLENPYGELLMCVAEEDGRIVSSYAALPSRVILNGSEVKAAISVNTMTHPDFAGRGLFVSLANRLYGEMESRGYAFVYGFPNLYSNKTFCSRLGWSDVYEIPTMQLSLEKFKADGDCCDTAEISPLKIKSAPENVLSVCKSPEYLAWRYNTEKYTFIANGGGWAAFKPYNDELNVVELHADSDEAMLGLVNYAAGAAARLGCKRLTSWAQTNTRKHYVFEKLGFRVSSPVRYFAIKQLNSDISTDITDYRLWSISMGDDNVY